MAMTRVASKPGSRALETALKPIGAKRTPPPGAGAWIPGVAIGAAMNGLVLSNPLAQGVVPENDPHGWTRADATAWRDEVRRIIDHWGSGAVVDMWDMAPLRMATGPL